VGRYVRLPHPTSHLPHPVVQRYLVVRLGHSILVVLGVSFVVFVISHLSGDPAALMLPPTASQQELDQFRRDMGFDRSLLLQYVDFIGRAVQGDFGRSLWTKQPAFSLVMERLPATLELAGAAMLISLLIAFPVGVFSATHRNSGADRLVLAATVLAQSMAIFWLGLMLIMLFGVILRWLPVSGRGTVQHLVLPALALSLYSAARNARIIRSSMLETLGQDYVRTARAKGLGERLVVWRHALGNALIPVVTLIGLQFGALLGGAVVTETVFAWPGVGRLMVQAITFRDFPLLQACVFFVSLVFVLVNLVVDLLYATLDPRIRLAR
jgi:ABC-type dipeptide/oligopeptide/nickel transport system permease component